MSEVVLLVPNDWVSEKVLIAVTGLKPGTILRSQKRMLDGWAGVCARFTGRKSETIQRVHVQP